MINSCKSPAMYSKFLFWRVVGRLPNGLFLHDLYNGGDPNCAYKSWDDPPSRKGNLLIVGKSRLDEIL